KFQYKPRNLPYCQREIECQSQRIAGDLDRLHFEVPQFLAHRNPFALCFKQLPRVIHQLVMEVVREAVCERRTHHPDVHSVPIDAFYCDILKSNRAVSIIRGRHDSNIERISETHASPEEISRRPSGEVRPYPEPPVRSRDIRMLQVGEVAALALTPPHILASLLGEFLLLEEAGEGRIFNPYLGSAGDGRERQEERRPDGQCPFKGTRLSHTSQIGQYPIPNSQYPTVLH